MFTCKREIGDEIGIGNLWGLGGVWVKAVLPISVSFFFQTDNQLSKDEPGKTLMILFSH